MSKMVKILAKTPGVKKEQKALHTRRDDQSQSMSTPIDRIMFFQRTIGNQAVQRLIKSGDLQTKLRMRQHGYRVAEQVADVGTSIPILGEKNEEVEICPADKQPIANNDAYSIFELPNGDSGSGVGSGGGGSTSCDQPLSMNKVTSGSFQGGKSMDDYYPDLVGRGFWQHSGSAGPWDTGSRVGSSVQLYGTIPSPCRPELFSLAQTVTRTRDRINGVTDPTEGQTLDDIAKSGRDASRPPFRQDWLGGGYNISMADPPSIGYSSTTNAEWDRDFVTSLVGPGGRSSVSWSVSIRIKDGSVTRNTVS